MANLVIEKAIIRRAVQSTKDPTRCYFDVVDLSNGGDFSFGTKAATAAQILQPGAVPLRIEGDVQGRSWQGKQFMDFTKLALSPIGQSGK